MNRIGLSVVDSPKRETAAERPGGRRGRAAGRSHGDLPYCLFTPAHYEQGYSYPLIVWLHHRGGREHDVLEIMPHVSLRNYVAIAPRGIAMGEAEYGWPAGFASSEIEQRILRSIQIARRHHSLSRRHIFLAGYQEGGTMALQLATLAPRRFAGAISLGGRFPRQSARFCHLPEAGQLPLMIAHGRSGVVYSEEHACRDLELLHTANMALSVRQYPGGDELDEQMLADMNRWMMELVVEQNATPL